MSEEEFLERFKTALRSVTVEVSQIPYESGWCRVEVKLDGETVSTSDFSISSLL